MNANTATKSELIAFLVKGGDLRSPRKLRDLRVSDLRGMVQIMQDEELADLKAREAATSPSRGAMAARLVLKGAVDPSRNYTVAEVAELTGLTKAAVRRWVRIGQLTATTDPQVKREGQFAIDGAELGPFLATKTA